MTTTVTAAAPSRMRPVVLRDCYRFELLKLIAQWRVRLMFGACLVAPAVYTAVISRQTSLPADAVYGRWMNQSGWAGSLVILVFLGAFALPLLTSLVAGDIFATEDRLGTWRHLLVAVRSPRLIFVSKALAALTVILALLVALAVSSTVGGLASVGNHPLPGLDGHPMDSGELTRTVLLAWLSIVPPTLAFAGVGLLGSVALGRSPLGLLMPVVLALALSGLALMPVPVALRLALPTNAFIGYRGLLTTPGQFGPLWIGTAVSLAWAGLATLLAYRIFVRRDFTDLAHDGSGLRFAVAGLVPLAALTAATTVAIAATTGGTGSGIERPKLEAALATSFSHLYVRQTNQLHRPAVTKEQLKTTARCDKAGDRVEDVGPGADWRCVVTWTLPGTRATGNAIYQLDVAADGRYVADGDGPKEVNGYFQIHTPTGDAPNPLWQFDGFVDLLDDQPKE
ncbi:MULTISPECIES: ABC transporter permease [unclassified Nocardioides]|uniref:ABC transporter permease n=1 Tax=unclassified Nocardioides TaxID=2615069 RepID=UPI0006F46624|nr:MULTISPECIES: ABC transporter permease [unclassified Nocardioides]KQY64421.1 ABC transporter permease [Nocardioides sp. Root140]KRF18192.1 ABC transporter permease [Nocardioides sp. Soil796]